MYPEKNCPHADKHHHPLTNQLLIFTISTAENSTKMF